ncbi:MAG: DNA polymerase III subunit delta [FCB group bacterium]|nr:DNA polymerase III subunit delta [FCB group bacterium]
MAVAKSKIETAGQAIRDIHTSGVKPAYLLLGDDGFLQDLFIDEIEKYFLQGNGTARYLSMDDDTEQHLIGELSTYSLFEEKRVFVVRQIGKITQKGKEELLSYISEPITANCLILINEEFTGKNKFLDTLKSTATAIDVRSPMYNKFKDWARYVAKKKSISITPSALDQLIELQGDSLSRIFNEMDKLSLMLEEGQTIDENTIRESTLQQRGYFIWQFLDSLGNRDLNKSIQIFHSLRDNSFQTPQITINLTAFFSEILWRKMGDSGHSVNWLLNKIIQGRLQSYTANFTIEDCMRILGKLRKIDVLSKSASLSMESLLEPLILDICEGIYV